MHRSLARLVAFGVVAVAAVANLHAAAPITLPTDDPSAIFRFDPFRNEMVVVPAAEIKPGYLYYRFSPQLGRRVWSAAVEGGGFDYAMAPGSVQLARALDLRATPEQLRNELAIRAPELAKIMDIRGGVAYVRLLDDQTWDLVRQPTIANVFDMETGRRWEWHGVRRVAVVHTGGYEWMMVNGAIVPGATYRIVSGASCW